jgi:hypothetical protein
MILRNHCSELVEFVYSGLVFNDLYYPVHPMIKGPGMHSKEDPRYENSGLNDVFYIPDDVSTSSFY